jgi:hypothetical protein
VNSYTVPRTTATGRAPVAAGDYRLLGAMFPANNPEWYFKYNGPADEVAKYEIDFDKLIKSARLGDNGLLEFAPPEGWQKGPERGGVVVATAKTTDGKQEVTLTRLPPAPDGAEANLTRWVKMIGLSPSADDMKKYTTVEAGNVKGLRVDLRGPKDPTTSKGGPMVPTGHP